MDETSGLLGRGNFKQRFRDTVYPLQRQLLVEFVGLVIFCFIGTLQAGSGGGVLLAAAAHGLTIFLLIASMGHISGGHYNPAVTLGVFLSGNIPVLSAAAYVIAQLTGGFCGSLLARAVATSDAWTGVLGGGLTMPDSSATIVQAILLEAVLTFLLVNSVLTSAVDTDSNVLAPFAIGLTVFVDICAGAKVSGASMNPARSFGPALCGLIFPPQGSLYSFDYHYIYWIGPALGAAVAAVMYKTFWAKEDSRWILK